MRSLSFAACTAALLFSTGASAADSQAEQRHKEGVASFSKWDFENARQSFLQAYALEPTPKFLWDLALAEAKSNHPVEALRHFRKYFKLPPATPAERDKVKPIIDDCERKTGRVRIELPAGAALMVDGAAIEEALTDQPIDVAPGAHAFEARLGAKTKSASASPAAGATVAVSLRFDPDPTPATTPPTTSSAALPSAGLPPEGEQPRATDDGPGAGRIVTVVAVGVGALASFGLSLAFHGASSSAQDKVDGYRAQYGASACGGSVTNGNIPCAAWDNARNSTRSDATLSTVFLVSGVVLSVATVAVWLLWPKGSERRSVWITPGLGGTGAGISF